MEIVNLNRPLTPQENTQRSMVLSNLVKIAGLKCVQMPKESIQIWIDQIENDLRTGVIVNVEAGFKKLLTERCYGGLDYAVFLEGAMPDKTEEANKAWDDLISKKYDNQKAVKVLRRFGGSQWLSDIDRKDVIKYRKEFIAEYKNLKE